LSRVQLKARKKEAPHQRDSENGKPMHFTAPHDAGRTKMDAKQEA